MSRYAVFQAIQKLDPQKDHQRIVFLSSCYDFSFDTTLDDSLIDAFGFPRPSRFMRYIMPRALRLRAALAGLLPPRRYPRLRTKMRHPSYPEGYVIERLGRRNLIDVKRHLSILRLTN